MLIIFVAQLLINGYHEFAEAGVLPATQQSMALVGPIMRNNSLFILALVAIPLFIWLSRDRRAAAGAQGSAAQKRLALARLQRERFYRASAVACTFFVLICVGVVYAQEIMPKQVPPPEMVMSQKGEIVLPENRFDDGRLNRFGYLVGDRKVRFLVLKTVDGKLRTTLDACAICGTFGYLEEGRDLMCLNCAAAINPMTLGILGGCNPIPIESKKADRTLRIRVASLEAHADKFKPQSGLAEIDPVCGMKVWMNEAAGFQAVGEITYYFCNEECLKKFGQNPHVYIN